MCQPCVTKSRHRCRAIASSWSHRTKRIEIASQVTREWHSGGGEEATGGVRLHKPACPRLNSRRSPATISVFSEDSPVSPFVKAFGFHSGVRAGGPQAACSRLLTVFSTTSSAHKPVRNASENPYEMQTNPFVIHLPSQMRSSES